MDGLTPDDHGFLNGLVNSELSMRRAGYDELRRKYNNNSLALEQIDIYDNESPYHPHHKALVKALRAKNRTIIAREEAWLAQNYPLTESRYKL